MRLPFEDWLNEQHLSGESEVAFQQAVIAYKAGAYRAALLFSFVGMGLCLRRRLLAASPPAGMTEGEWESVLRTLQSEDTWDGTVFDCTQRQKPPIFVVEDHLREEMKYWKNRRNDCAHFKRNEIGAPHVESFWLFLRSNLGRWVPNGSVKDVLERIAMHFDPNLTRPGADVAPIVGLIPHAVPETAIMPFFTELAATLTVRIGTVELLNSEALAIVLASMLQVTPAPYSTAAAEWLRANPERLLDVLRLSPQCVAVLNGHPANVRELWRCLLFAPGRQDLRVFCALLRASLIPAEEVGEAIARVVKDLNGQIPDQEEERTLREAGFWAAFDKKAFEDGGLSDFPWANTNAGVISWRLQAGPLPPATARAVCSAFNNEHVSWTARDVLRAMLRANPEKMTELTELAKTAGMSVPACLK